MNQFYCLKVEKRIKGDFFSQSKKCNRTLSYLVVEKKFLVILGNKLSKGDSERDAERFSEAKEVETGLKRVTN